MEVTGPKGTTSTWHFPDMQYELTPRTLTKRTSSLAERNEIEDHADVMILPWSRERLENEKETLEFIAQNTLIPVPRGVKFTKEDGISTLTTEALQDPWMHDLINSLSYRDKATLLTNVNSFVNNTVLPQLKTLKSNKIGGLCGVTIPPSRVRSRDMRLSWPSKIANTDR